MAAIRDLPEIVPIRTNGRISDFVFLDYERELYVQEARYYVRVGNSIQIKFLPFVSGEGFLSQLRRAHLPRGCVGYGIEEVGMVSEKVLYAQIQCYRQRRSGPVRVKE